jgi:hypothetical protein
MKEAAGQPGMPVHGVLGELRPGRYRVWLAGTSGGHEVVLYGVGVVEVREGATTTVPVSLTQGLQRVTLRGRRSRFASQADNLTWDRVEYRIWQHPHDAWLIGGDLAGAALHGVTSDAKGHRFQYWIPFVSGRLPTNVAVDPQ